MSNVTNLILCCSLRDEKRVVDLTFDFADIGAHFGGPKFVEAGVFGCAGNYVDEAELLAEVSAHPWEYPERIRIFIQRQDEDCFTQFYPVPESASPAPPGPRT